MKVSDKTKCMQFDSGVECTIMFNIVVVCVYLKDMSIRLGTVELNRKFGKMIF